MAKEGISFSREVKNELAKAPCSARHCQIAELTAIITMCGGVSVSVRDRLSLRIQTDTLFAAGRFDYLVRQLYGIVPEIRIRAGRGERSMRYTVAVPEHENAEQILQTSRLLTSDQDVQEVLSLPDNLIVQKSCCKRAFLRGAFLASGSISDPHKSYHFELVCQTRAKAQQLCSMIAAFGPEPKMVSRNRQVVVYLKEGSHIVDMLGIMEAPKALMDLENVRILREISNHVNRKVNCEAANIHKTVNAAVKQAKDIEYLQEHMGLDSLSDGLRQVAQLRLANPDLPLKDLGLLLDPPIGKSGVNHRLAKLSALADQLRGG